MWNFFFGRKKSGYLESNVPEKRNIESNVSEIRYLESNVSEKSTCPINCDCCPEDVCVCSDVEIKRSIKKIKLPPQLGVTRSGRPVIPHKCEHPSQEHPLSKNATAPSSTSVRSKSPSLFGKDSSRLSIKSHKSARASSSTSRHESKSPSLFGQDSSRLSIKSHKSARESSSTSRDELGPPPFPQFKSPTAPKYRPTVTPHKNCFDPGLPEPKKSSFWKWFLLALMLVGVAGTAFGPTLLRKARKKCLELKPCPP